MKKKVLDVTNEKCPMTFLKAKVFISANIGSEKTILIKGKKDFQMLKNNLEKNYKKLSDDIGGLSKDFIDNTFHLIMIDETQDFDMIMLKMLLNDTKIPKAQP